MKFKTLSLVFITLFLQTPSFAQNPGNPSSDHQGGDVVGSYQSGDIKPPGPSHAMDIARMKMAGNETVPGTETGTKGAAGFFLGLTFFLAFAFGIHKFIGFRSHAPLTK